MSLCVWHQTEERRGQNPGLSEYITADVRNWISGRINMYSSSRNLCYVDTDICNVT
jgi:hypothetical protein